MRTIKSKNFVTQFTIDYENVFFLCVYKYAYDAICSIRWIFYCEKRRNVVMCLALVE